MQHLYYSTSSFQDITDPYSAFLHLFSKHRILDGCSGKSSSLKCIQLTTAVPEKAAWPHAHAGFVYTVASSLMRKDLLKRTFPLFTLTTLQFSSLRVWQLDFFQLKFNWRMCPGHHLILSSHQCDSVWGTRLGMSEVKHCSVQNGCQVLSMNYFTLQICVCWSTLSPNAEIALQSPIN